MLDSRSWVPVRDAAAIMGVSVQGVMYKVRVGKVRLKKGTTIGVGREKINVVNTEDLNSWIEERKGDGRSIRTKAPVATKRKQVLAKSGVENSDKPRRKKLQGPGKVAGATAKRKAASVRKTNGKDKGLSTRQKKARS